MTTQYRTELRWDGADGRDLFPWECTVWESHSKLSCSSVGADRELALHNAYAGLILTILNQYDPIFQQKVQNADRIA